MTTVGSYSRMVFSKGFLPDGQSIVEQVSGLFVFVLIPARVRGTDNVTKLNVCCYLSTFAHKELT